MKTKILSSALICLLIFTAGLSYSQETEKEAKSTKKLVVLWTSSDTEVAKKMVFMYTYNSIRFEWWEDVTLLIWGPSQKLLTEDKELQDYLGKMKEVGIKLLACKACADLYGIEDQLKKLGVEVRYTGQDLTDFISDKGYHLITL